jgi:hypothetical protein
MVSMQYSCAKKLKAGYYRNPLYVSSNPTEVGFLVASSPNFEVFSAESLWAALNKITFK